EHRLARSFRYGGVIECRDGYVELLTLEQRQWHGLIELMNYPEWALDASLEDAVVRSQRGDFINEEIRRWASRRPVEEIVVAAQRLGVPMARYNTPEQVLSGHHEASRGLFSDMPHVDGGRCVLQTAPFRFGNEPLPARPWPPRPDKTTADKPHEVEGPTKETRRERA
ncbi:CoA transferase, partial [bacterium]